MNVRFGFACLSLLISCWCFTTSSVSAASNGIRPRRQSRIATLNEYLTPPAPPNGHTFRGTGISRHPRNYQQRGPSQLPQGSGPPSLPIRHGKILTPPGTQSPGYFSRLMGWLNPFGGSSSPRVAPSQRPDNQHQENFNSEHPQPQPPSNAYGPPAPSYGPPTNSYEGHLSGKTLPRPPAPQGGQAYLPPQQARNCNPCNQVPWTPLYHGINTADSRYAAGSTNVASLQSLDSPLNSYQTNGGTNIYRVSSVSHEVKTPDFSYGPPQQSPIFDPNHRASSSSIRMDANNNNQNRHNENLNFPQTDYSLPLTGPIPNPHLYPGAMPPLFKAKPFDSQPQGTDTSFNPPSISQFNQPDTSFYGGRIETGHVDYEANSGASSFKSSLDLNVPFSGSQDHQLNEQSSQNSGFEPSIEHQYEQQQFPNVESSPVFKTSIDHHESPPQHSVSSLAEGYVDELPPGAETIPSGPDDHFPPTSFEANDNGAANSNFRDNLHSSTDHETKSDASSITFGAGQSATSENSGNIKQSTRYGSQESSDGQHVIHYEQSPIIDLSSIGENDRRKNDSSASSSTSTDALKDPPVILQNSDGTYGINATWSDGDSSKIQWPEDDETGTTVSSTSLPRKQFTDSDLSVKSEDFGASSTDIPVIFLGAEENRPDFTEHTDQSPRNISIHEEQNLQPLNNENRTDKDNYDFEQSEIVQGSRRELGGPSKILETLIKQKPDSFSPYPGLIRFEDSKSYGFRLPDLPSDSASEVPFFQALMKSYANYKKYESQNGDQVKLVNREPSFDPRQIHVGAGFKPSQDQWEHGASLGDGKLRSGNRQQGAKKNKQVQIIIPYTSQYTPEPFRPLREDWSTKTSPVQTQARKVSTIDTNREYVAQETRRDEVSHVIRPLENSSIAKVVTRIPNGAKANTSIDVLRLQKNIDNWTIQEYSRGTTASIAIPKFSHPYLSPSKKIPKEYLTTTEPVVPFRNTLEDTGKDIGNALNGFSFNDLEHEGSASDQIDISHVQVSSHINEVSSVFPEIVEVTTATSVVTPTIERDTWKRLPVSISPLNMERVYVVTPQSVSTLSTTTRLNDSYDKPVRNETTKISKMKPDLEHFESIERAYQVLPQAVNNLVVASTGPATIPLWGIMEHEKYAASNNTLPESPILYTGHSKVSHTRQ